MNEINEAIMDAMILLDPPPLMSHQDKNNYNNNNNNNNNNDSSDSNPPPLSSTIVPTSIRQAHEILLSVASLQSTIDLHCQTDAPSDNDKHSTHCHKKDSLISDTVTTIADLYRAMIVSSNLLLEVLVSERYRKEKSTVTASSSSTSSSSSSFSEQEEIQSLHSTIIQSILLLKRLSHMSYMNNPPRKFMDWHDDLLPKSRHSLLQECFQRNVMMDVEGDVVFGLEDRLVSLNPEDYAKDAVFLEGGSWDGVEQETDVDGAMIPMVSTTAVCKEDHGEEEEQEQEEQEEQEQEQEEQEQVEWMTWNPMELAQEECGLLEIALPGYLNSPAPPNGEGETQANANNNHNNKNNNKKNKNKKKRRKFNPQHQQHDPKVVAPCEYLSTAMICQLREMHLFHHVELPLYGLPCIMKQGWLILKLLKTQHENQHEDKSKPSKEKHVQCHAILLANGILLLEFHHGTDNREAFHTMDMVGNIKMWTVTSTTRCIASPSKHTFYFHVSDLMECCTAFTTKDLQQSTTTKKESNGCNREKEHFLASSLLLLGVDVDRGGSLMDGYRWMTAIDDCVKFLDQVQQVKHDLLGQKWKNM